MRFPPLRLDRRECTRELPIEAFRECAVDAAGVLYGVPGCDRLVSCFGIPVTIAEKFSTETGDAGAPSGSTAVARLDAFSSVFSEDWATSRLRRRVGDGVEQLRSLPSAGNNDGFRRRVGDGIERRRYLPGDVTGGSVDLSPARCDIVAERRLRPRPPPVPRRLPTSPSQMHGTPMDTAPQIQELLPFIRPPRASFCICT